MMERMIYVDGTILNTSIHNNIDNIDINSYNKTYSVKFCNKELIQIINDNYEYNDFIVIDKNVYNLNKDCLNNLNKKYIYFFEANEQNKSMESVLEICDILNNLKFNKKHKVLVIGGGITQDVAGFACAIYKRGINWILIPTTLLSMTDSCIGGKVCINRQSKNILSVFMAPNKIIISDLFLKTLNNDDIISGLGEALKLSLIHSNDAYIQFKKYYSEQKYNDIINLSIQIKKVIIELDELEKHERKVLNYGHTFGHCIESASSYFIPHGIAVLYGMYIINKIFYNDKYEEVNNFILNMIPDKFKNIKLNYDDIINNIKNDKKNDGIKICFIVLDNFGKTKIIYRSLDIIENKIKLIFNELFN
jgi:3-dehydroquinate synthase